MGGVRDSVELGGRVLNDNPDPEFLCEIVGLLCDVTYEDYMGGMTSFIFLNKYEGSLMYRYFGEIPEAYIGQPVRIKAEDLGDNKVQQTLSLFMPVPEIDGVPEMLEPVSFKLDDFEYDEFLYRHRNVFNRG